MRMTLFVGVDQRCNRFNLTDPNDPITHRVIWVRPGYAGPVFDQLVFDPCNDQNILIVQSMHLAVVECYLARLILSLQLYS